MRGLFGLVSLLIGVALVAYLWSSYTSTVSKSAAKPTTRHSRSAEGMWMGNRLETR